MLITDTVDKLKGNRNLLFIISFLVFTFLSGCAQKSDLDRAKEYISKSDSYYQMAIGIYRNLIAKVKDADTIHYQLGEIYYRHGEYKLAIEEFKKSNDINAKKLMAISYYLIGDFTAALDAFKKNEIDDEEYLYYYGLTCERLNLFDDAITAYKRMSEKGFNPKAFERMNIIQKETGTLHIKDVNPIVADIIDRAPSQENYPQAGALILLSDERITVTSENTMISELHYVVKILNERGKEEFSESHLDYDSTYEKVELEYARTIKPDGMVVEVGSRHIRDVSKYLNFPLYSNVRVFIISFPEITEGAVIDYKLKVYRNQLIDKKHFVLNYPVQAQEPICAADFSVDLPKTTPLNIKILNEKYNDFKAELNPKIQTSGERLRYYWQFKDIPQIIPESSMPPSSQINPSILISTFSSWDEVYRWWWALAKDKINPDAGIKDKVRELISEGFSEEDKIRAIYNFCAQKIRYVAVEYGQAGYEPHKAEDIFKNKYGDCKDQAILLVSMLRQAGLSAWPVLIPTKEYYNLNPDFPSVMFDHCIVSASLGGSLIFLDPTTETCSFGDLPVSDQARKVLVLKETGYSIETTPLYPAEHNLIKQKLNIKVNDDEGISADKIVYSKGTYDQAQRYWLLYTPPQLIEEALKERIQDISIGSSLEGYEIKNMNTLNDNVILSYKFRGSEYMTAAGEMRIVPQLASWDTSLVAKDKRKYAIDFGFLDCKDTIVELEIPDNFTVKYMPENVSLDNQWLKFDLEYNYQDKKIYFRQKVELKVVSILEEEYPEVKNLFEALAKRIKQRIILEKVR